MSRLTSQSLRVLFMSRARVRPGSGNEISPPPPYPTFSRLPSWLPSLSWRAPFSPLWGSPLDWEAKQLRKNLLVQPVSCWKRLAHSQDGKHVTTANSSEHVKSFYSHVSLEDQKAKDTLVISLILWISTPPRPATHFWFLCSERPGICSVGNLN